MTEIKVIEHESSEVEILMTLERAKELTEDIKSTTSALYVLLKQAHDHKAWLAMGYNSWSEYIEKEFDFSRARSYQLLNQANVIEELTEASGVPLYISEREARAIKKRLPEITEKIRDEVKDAEDKEAVEKRVNQILEEEVDSAEREIDRANSHRNGGGGNPKEDEDDAYEDSHYEATDRDEGGYKKPSLSEEDKFFYDNLVVTLNIFKQLPDATEFGKILKRSSIDKKELLKLSENAFAWITKIIEELE